MHIVLFADERVFFMQVPRSTCVSSIIYYYLYDQTRGSLILTHLILTRCRIDIIMLCKERVVSRSPRGIVHGKVKVLQRQHSISKPISIHYWINEKKTNIGQSNMNLSPLALPCDPKITNKNHTLQQWYNIALTNSMVIMGAHIWDHDKYQLTLNNLIAKDAHERL